MIIQCINCKKKFEVDSSLIPETGRNIQCGSCNHIWFYKDIKTISSSIDQDLMVVKDIEINKDVEEKINFEQEINDNKDIMIDNNVLSKKNKSSNNFYFGRVLSYILVGIISCIAFVIVLDTFKSPLNNIFPSLELLLYNLFQTIEDMFLFINNLLT